MTDDFGVVCDFLEKGEPLVLATVISSQGSSPRSAGTRMVISRDGAGHGTIGGGLLEARVTEGAVAVLSEGRSRILYFDLTHRDVAALDMICGGRVDVLLDLVAPTAETIALFQGLRQARNNGEDCLFITCVRGHEGTVERIDRSLILKDGGLSGECPLAPTRLDDVTASGWKSPYLQVISEDDGLVVVQPIVTPKRLVLLGGGHVARPTAHLAAMVGFRVTVIDDRAEFADRNRFPEAAEVRVVPDFDRALSDVPVDGNTYIVIVTRGHLHDRTVLIQALRTPAAYVGMIGSRRKRDAIFGALLKQGFGQADIDRVYSPIGLNIGAETPEEIAVSIVAELIRIRAEREK